MASECDVLLLARRKSESIAAGNHLDFIVLLQEREKENSRNLLFLISLNIWNVYDSTANPNMISRRSPVPWIHYGCMEISLLIDAVSSWCEKRRKDGEMLFSSFLCFRSSFSCVEIKLNFRICSSFYDMILLLPHPPTQLSATV